MNLLDFLILLPILYTGFRGFSKGFVKEIFSIIGIILAVFITFEYMDEFSVILDRYVNWSADTLNLVAGSILFIVTLAVIHSCSYIVERAIKVVKLNFINRLFGLAFGTLKAGIVVSVFLLLLTGFDLPGQESRERSVTYPYVISLAPAFFDMIAVVYPGAEDFITTIQNTLDESNPIYNLHFFNQSDLNSD